MPLRAYQKVLAGKIRRAFDDNRRIFLQLPTGGGKTFIARDIAGRYRRAGSHIWFVCHHREMMDQTGEEFAKAGIPYGLIKSGEEEKPGELVQICSVMSLEARLENYPAPDLIIWDEAHHTPAARWSGLMTKFGRALHLGLSATPLRLDGKPLGDLFGHLIEGPSRKQLEDGKFIRPCTVFGPKHLTLLNIPVRGGEYDLAASERAMTDSVLIGDVIAHYRERASGRSAIAFCKTVKASKKIAERFNAAGIPAGHIDGEMSKEDRDAVLEDYKAGRILILCNCEIFTEGLHIPDTGAIILLRPTLSLALFLQMVGRGGAPSKLYPDLIILDHCGLCFDHGMPDEDREWSLTQAPKKRSRTEVVAHMRHCPKCSAVHAFDKEECPRCGHEYKIGDRSIAEELGLMVEISGPPEGCESKRAFARRMGITHKSVYRWLKKGIPSRSGFIDIAEGMIWVEKMHSEHRAKCAKRLVKKMKNPEYKAAVTAALNSPESKAKAAASNRTPEARANNLASKRTSEARANFSKASVEKMKNPEYKAAVLAALHSPESKAKSAAALRTLEGRANNLASKRTPEARANFSKAGVEKMKNPEYKAAVLAALHSPEARAKCAATRARRKAASFETAAAPAANKKACAYPVVRAKMRAATRARRKAASFETAAARPPQDEDNRT